MVSSEYSEKEYFAPELKAQYHLPKNCGSLAQNRGSLNYFSRGDIRKLHAAETQLFNASTSLTAR